MISTYLSAKDKNPASIDFEVSQIGNVLEMPIDTALKISQVLGLSLSIDTQCRYRDPCESLLIRIGDAHDRGRDAQHFAIASGDRAYIALTSDKLDAYRRAIVKAGYTIAIVSRRSSLSMRSTQLDRASQSLN